MEETIIRNVILEKSDFETVKQVATENGLGSKGFSAALRIIIRAYARTNPTGIVKIGSNGSDHETAN